MIIGVPKEVKDHESRVGVTPVFPWVFRNKSGGGDEYRGSSWELAKAYADALGVKLEVVGGIPVWEALPSYRHQNHVFRIQSSIRPIHTTAVLPRP